MEAEVISIENVGDAIYTIQPVHENDNYIVLVEGMDGYKTVNKTTGVIEFRDAQIANAITYAEHANSFLTLRLWRMVTIQGAKSAEFLDKEDAVVSFTSDLGDLEPAEGE